MTYGVVNVDEVVYVAVEVVVEPGCDVRSDWGCDYGLAEYGISEE